MIFERVANYICDHNRGKATEDERKQFETELLDGSIIRDFDLLKETLTTLLADETAEAKELADELAGAYNSAISKMATLQKLILIGLEV